MKVLMLNLLLATLVLGISSSQTVAQNQSGRSAVALLETSPTSLGASQRAELRLPFEPQTRKVAEVVALPRSPLGRLVLPARGQQALIRLFDGEEQIATTVSVNVRNEVSTWVGRIDHPQHDRAGFMTLSEAADGSVYGTISFEERHYQVVTGRNGKAYLVEVDHSLFPQADFSNSEPEAKVAAKPAVVGEAKTTAALNVLVVYT